MKKKHVNHQEWLIIRVDSLLNVKVRLSCLTLLLLIIFFKSADAQNWKLIKPVFPSNNTFVAAYNVADFGAKGDGITDVTSIFQQRLNALGAIKGGTLFVPSGKYVLKGTLVIPRGVTIRGEWQKPVKGMPIAGTILMAYAGKGSETSAPFISLDAAAAVMDLAIWYPEQQASGIIRYPPAIQFGVPGSGGDQYCNARNITLVNAYSGIVLDRANGGASPTISNIYGTPLSRGVEIDNIADVGHIEWLNFSPAYWAGSGLPGSPARGTAYENWILQNGTGVVMRRNDWSYTDYVQIEGYHIGFHSGPSIASPGAIPNGYCYDMTLTNCQTGIYFEVDPGIGVMYSRINIQNCGTGISLSDKTQGAIQFQSSTIDASSNAINIAAGSTSTFHFLKSVINRGKINVNGATFNATDCDFNNTAPQIAIGPDGRSIITGNRFKNPVQIKNNSQFLSIIDHTPVTLKALPDVPQLVPVAHLPAKQVLYLATASPYKAVPDNTTDNTRAIQSALNAAGSAGGGVVFLPPGKYKVSGNLSVPAGVELKGAADVSTTPVGTGSIIEVYAGRGSATGTPFLRLGAGSGVRGITFDYPEQLASMLPSVPAYPYLIQGNGKNIYIINIGVRATYNAIDLYTNKCDNHFVDYVAGHIFRNAFKVGGGSVGGKITNSQFNTIAYAVGREEAWGNWPNSPEGDNKPVYDDDLNNCKFIILDNCVNEVLYNNFDFGNNEGLVFTADKGKGATGYSIGQGIDGSRKGMHFKSGSGNSFDFICTQFASASDTTSRFILSDAGFKSQINFYSSTYGGNTGKSLDLSGGTFNFQEANFFGPGQESFATIKTGAVANIDNSSVWPATVATDGSEKRLLVRSSIIDSTGIQTKNAGLWKNNLSNAWRLLIGGDLDRRAWTATASVNTGAVMLALDSNIFSRWDTHGPQVNGQYYTVDMKTVNTIDRIMLDVGNSFGDSPSSYEVYLSNDGVNFGKAVKTGSGTAGLTIIEMARQKARFIKILQTGNKDTYWSIEEFHVFGQVNVASVKINPDSLVLDPQKTMQLTFAISPATAYNKKVTWRSGNSAVASVSATGMVTALAEGKTTIYVTSVDGGKMDSCKLTVNAALPTAVAAITITPATVQLVSGGSQQLSVNILPANATNKNLSWSSSNTLAATVNSNGLVKGGLTGTAVITVKSADGGKSATVKVTIRNTFSAMSNDTSITVFPNPLTANRINVRFPNSVSGKYTFRFTESNGHLIKSAMVDVLEGNGAMSVDNRVKPGLYILEMTNSETNERTIRKILVP